MGHLAGTIGIAFCIGIIVAWMVPQPWCYVVGLPLAIGIGWERHRNALKY